MKFDVVKETSSLGCVISSPQIAIYARCGYGGSVDNQIEACKKSCF